MSQSTSTPPSCFCSCFFHLNSVHSLPLLSFLRFLDFIYFWILSTTRHRHPPTAFYDASAFNADLSNWNTAAVTSMEASTSTSPSCVCCCFFHLNSVHSPSCFFSFFSPSFFQQWLQTNIVRRTMVTCIDFVQRHQWSIRLLRRGHLHGKPGIKSLCQSQCLSKLPNVGVQSN